MAKHNNNNNNNSDSNKTFHQTFKISQTMLCVNCCDIINKILLTMKEGREEKTRQKKSKKFQSPSEGKRKSEIVLLILSFTIFSLMPSIFLYTISIFFCFLCCWSIEFPWHFPLFSFRLLSTDALFTQSLHSLLFLFFWFDYATCRFMCVYVCVCDFQEFVVIFSLSFFCCWLCYAVVVNWAKQWAHMICIPIGHT